jgi:hypothetical protein
MTLTRSDIGLDEPGVRLALSMLGRMAPRSFVEHDRIMAGTCARTQPFTNAEEMRGFADAPEAIGEQRQGDVRECASAGQASLAHTRDVRFRKRLQLIAPGLGQVDFDCDGNSIEDGD